MTSDTIRDPLFPAFSADRSRNSFLTTKSRGVAFTFLDFSMTNTATEWPSTSVPEPFKQLLTRFFVAGDTPTAEAGRQLGEEIFTADGQIIVNKNVITGTARM